MPSARASEKGALASKITATSNDEDNRPRQRLEAALIRRDDGASTRTAAVNIRDLLGIAPTLGSTLPTERFSWWYQHIG
jgi:hypothetical protein